jgi:methyl-accepting chemotaxis protein
LLIYVATVLLVYQSSKASTEALAEVAVDAIAKRQATEISDYFNVSLYSARNTARLLGAELIDGQLQDRRIADQMIELAAQHTPGHRNLVGAERLAERPGGALAARRANPQPSVGRSAPSPDRGSWARAPASGNVWSRCCI